LAAIQTVLYRETPKQSLFAQAALSGVYRFILYGGAIRGGKTFALLALYVYLCHRYPRSRWAIVRKDLPSIRSTILPSYEKLRPASMAPVNQSTWISRCQNGSELIFWPEGYKDDKELNRWRGLEVNGFGLEECNELQEVTYLKALERAGTWVVPPGCAQPPVVNAGTCNPNKAWPKDRFYDLWQRGDLEPPLGYIPATAYDNPHMPDGFYLNLDLLRRESPFAYAKFVEGDWDVSEGDEFKPDMFRYHSSTDYAMHRLECVFDLAYTKKKTSDFTAGGVFGIDAAAAIRWFWTDEQRLDESESIDLIFRVWKEWSPRGLRRVHVEAHSSYLHAIRQEQELRGVRFPVVELKTNGVSKADRIRNVKAYLPRMYFREGYDDWLVNRFLDWSLALEGTVPDDGPDMVGYACKVSRYAAGQSDDWKPPLPKMTWKSAIYDIAEEEDAMTSDGGPIVERTTW